MPIGTPGSLVALIDKLVAFEQGALQANVSPALPVVRWQPFRLPPVPGIFNFLSPSPVVPRDTAHVRDVIRIFMRVSLDTSSGDGTQAMVNGEFWSDEFRLQIDKAMNERGIPTFAPAAQKARRNEMRVVDLRYPDTTLRCLQFQLEFDVERLYAP